MEQVDVTMEQMAPGDERTEQPVTERVLSLKRLGRSIRQIADAVGIPPTTVHRLIHLNEEQDSPDPVPPPPESLLARLEQEKQHAEEATAAAQRTYQEAREQLREAETALREAEGVLTVADAADALEAAARVREAKVKVEDIRGVVAVLNRRWTKAREAEVMAGAKVNEARGHAHTLRTQVKQQQRAVRACQQSVTEGERMLGAYKNSLGEAEQILTELTRKLVDLTGAAA